MKTLKIETDGSITVTDAASMRSWNHANAVEAAKCAGEWTAPELAAAPAVAAVLSAPDTQAKLIAQRATLLITKG